MNAFILLKLCWLINVHSFQTSQRLSWLHESNVLLSLLNLSICTTCTLLDRKDISIIYINEAAKMQHFLCFTATEYIKLLSHLSLVGKKEICSIKYKFKFMIGRSQNKKTLVRKSINLSIAIVIGVVSFPGSVSVQYRDQNNIEIYFIYRSIGIGHQYWHR